jgi:hypothetical protein
MSKPKFNPRSAVVYFDLVFDEDNYLEDTEEENLPDDQVILRWEDSAMREIAEGIGHRVSNEGHDSYGILVCKVFPDTLRDVEKMVDWVMANTGGGDDIVYLDNHFSAGQWTLFPQGVNGPRVMFADFDEWLEEE